jgi:hypothetical protein
MWIPPDDEQRFADLGSLFLYRYWQIYQASVYPYYPALVTFDVFSVALFSFLDYDRERREKTDPTWLALMFAVLACGAQFSDDAIEERDLRCKVFSKRLL